MNDITALAQRMSVERILEIAKGGTPTIGEKERLAITALYFHQKLQICTKAFQSAGLAQLAAEEALEKAQKSNEFLKGQLSELANFNPDWDKLEASYESWREIAAELLVAKNRIAELESRTVTVKLPQRLQPGADGYDDWYVHSDDDGEYLKASDVIAVLAAAGIQVIEGEQKNG